MVRQLHLTQDMVAIVDDEDYASVASHKWHVTKTNGDDYPKYYAARSGPWELREDGTKKRPKIYLHRFITNCHAPDKIVDHFNGNSLDCTRRNLMITGYYWNNHNRDSNIETKSGMRGVYQHGRLWEAKIISNHVTYWLGNFADPVEAALAYDAKSIELYGPYARTNLREGRLDGKVDMLTQVLPPELAKPAGLIDTDAPF